MMEEEINQGIRLKITSDSNIGGRAYMEDMYITGTQPTADNTGSAYNYFGIFDGHGGAEAAIFARENLMNNIVSRKGFWSENDKLILQAIRQGFLKTHHDMWKDQKDWKRHWSGYLSTAGSTATIGFIKNGKLYVGQLGDSSLALGWEDPNTGQWCAQSLTRRHKPNDDEEIARVIRLGRDGTIRLIERNGRKRVAWIQPRLDHTGTVRRSTQKHEIVSLAMTRAFGNFWSFNPAKAEFAISPEPDCSVHVLDPHTHRCLIFASDGIWDVFDPQYAMRLVEISVENERKFLEANNLNAKNRARQFLTTNENNVDVQLRSPSQVLVREALHMWWRQLKAPDNISAITVLMEPAEQSSSSSSSSLMRIPQMMLPAVVPHRRGRGRGRNQKNDRSSVPPEAGLCPVPRKRNMSKSKSPIRASASKKASINQTPAKKTAGAPNAPSAKKRAVAATVAAANLTSEPAERARAKPVLPPKTIKSKQTAASVQTKGKKSAKLKAGPTASIASASQSLPEPQLPILPCITCLLNGTVCNNGNSFELAPQQQSTSSAVVGMTTPKKRGRPARPKLSNDTENQPLDLSFNARKTVQTTTQATPTARGKKSTSGSELGSDKFKKVASAATEKKSTGRKKAVNAQPNQSATFQNSKTKKILSANANLEQLSPSAAAGSSTPVKRRGRQPGANKINTAISPMPVPDVNAIIQNGIDKFTSLPVMRPVQLAVVKPPKKNQSKLGSLSSLAAPTTANGSESTVMGEKQPAKRGRPFGSKNKYPSKRAKEASAAAAVAAAGSSVQIVPELNHFQVQTSTPSKKKNSTFPSSRTLRST